MKIVLISILVAISAYLYEISNIKNEYIKSLNMSSIELEKRYGFINSIEQLHKKIDNIDIKYTRKNDAQIKLLQKVVFYQNQFNAQLKTNILEKNNLFVIEFTVEISDMPKEVLSLLNKLKQDNYLKVMDIRKVKNKIKLHLKLLYPFVSEQISKQIEIYDVLNKYHSVNNRLSTNDLIFDDIDITKNIKVIKPITIERIIKVKEKKHKISQKVIEILPKVQLILIGSKKTAIINSKIVNIGDIIDSYKIIDINAKGVLVEDSKGRKWLKVSN